MGLSYVAWVGRGVSVVRMGTFKLVHTGDVLCARGWLAGSVAGHLGKLCVQRGVGRAGFWARQLGRWSVAWVVWRDGQLG